MVSCCCTREAHSCTHVQSRVETYALPPAEHVLKNPGNDALQPTAPPTPAALGHNSNASMASLWKSALRRSTSFILSEEYGFLPPVPLPPKLPASPGRLGFGGGRNSSASDGRSELSRRTCNAMQRNAVSAGFGRGRFQGGLPR